MDLWDYKKSMQKAVDYLATELKGIQVGVATPTMLDTVVVKASYGDMKISGLWHVSVLDSHTIKVEAWDKKENKHIAAAIYDANLGLTPVNEWEYVLVKIPEITKERREEIAKKIKSLWEDIKARIRVARQDGHKASKQLLANKEISEDEHKNNESDIDEYTKQKNAEIDTLITDKVTAIMKV